MPSLLTGSGWLACALSIATPAAALDVADLAAAAKPAVVHLAILGPTGSQVGNGTGFFVTSTGWVVTNEHVIAGATEIRAVLSDGSKRAVLGVLARDVEHDLAVLQVEGSGFASLELGTSADIREGVPVVAIGSPLGLSFTTSEGIVAALRGGGLPQELTEQGQQNRGPLIQITAAISPGSSGSPVLSQDGKVIGVAVLASTRGAQNVNFAVPVDVLQALLERIPADVKPAPLAPTPWLNLFISGAVVAAIALAFVLSRTRRRRRGAA